MEIVCRRRGPVEAASDVAIGRTRALGKSCREHGTRELWGSVQAENAAMLHLAEKLGFRARRRELNVVEVVLDLRASPAT